MLFNSLNFLIFFPIILLLFYVLRREYRWMLLLAGSIYFYMAWKAEYIILITFYVIVNYLCALKIEAVKDQTTKKRVFYIAVFFNLSILFFFKYFNFFNDNLNELFGALAVNYKSSAHDLILPMGISFYTFQVMSYTIDVYRYNLKAERHFGKFFLFVTFFPQLVAGPIERAGNLMTQLNDLRNKLTHKDVVSGIHQIILGFFKKLVIADRLSPYVDQVYIFPEGYSGLNLAIATFFFSVQIYCDFSGYSDIAIGSARLLGINLMENFKSPYFSKTISEFWSRWHISLSTWFRDYVYIPMGGNRVIKWKWYYNLFITFMVSGFWHGANWTFIAWGILHGLFLIVSILAGPMKARFNEALFNRVPLLKSFFDISVTFILVYFAWIFFRAENIQDAWLIVGKILFMTSDMDKFILTLQDFGVFTLMVSIFSIAVLFIYEFGVLKSVLNRGEKGILVSSCILFALTLILGVMGSKSFIYFQF